MKKVSVTAPAKVNLFLQVKKKRPDGFHELFTLFEKISITDSVYVTGKPSGIRLVTSSPGIPKGPGNICIRAAEAFFEQTGIKPGVEIGLTKNIPVGAGLGGGSSDAAATLLALDKLFGSGLGPERIRKIGATLGSDVAFFTQDKAFCLGRGRGERLSPLNWDMKLWHLVIYPGIKMLTAGIYSKYAKKTALTLTRKRRTARILPPIKGYDNMGQLATHLHNDLEDVVLETEPNIRYIKDFLYTRGALGALVSGSGASVFGLFSSKKEAMRAKKESIKRLPVSKGWRLFVAETYA